jgi:MFS family permease
MHDLTVLRDATYTLAQNVVCVGTIALYSLLLLLPLFLQNVRGLGAMETGLLLLPYALAAAAMMPVAGWLTDKLGARPLAVVGLALLAAATAMVSGIEPGTPDNYLVVALILRGLGTGLMFMPVMTVAMDNIPPPQIPRATALSNVIRQLVGAFCTALFASLLADHMRLHTAALMQVTTPLSIAAQHVLVTTQLAMEARGYSAEAAHALGVVALQHMVQLAATVRAFDDCFRIATVPPLIGVLPALFLRRKRRAAHGSPGAHEAVIELG